MTMHACRLCGEQTSCVVNINLQTVPVCDPCTWTVTKQTIAAFQPIPTHVTTNAVAAWQRHGCCCRHPDRQACYQIRYPDIPTSPDDVCDCICHYSDDPEEDDR